MISLDIGSLFLSFINDFNDEKGRNKYNDYVEEMLILRKKSFYLDFKDVITFSIDLADEIIKEPLKVLPIMENSLYNLLREKDPDYEKEIKRVHIRVINLPRSYSLREIRSELVGKLITIEGILVKSTPLKERVVKAWFKHEECGAEFSYPESEEMGEIIEIPQQCPRCRKGGRMKLIEEKTILVDWQKAILQERPEEIPAGQLPRQLEIIFEDDLIDTTRPGDRVKIVGVLQVRYDNLFRRGTRSVFDLYLTVNSIEVSQKVLDEVTLSEEDEREILRIGRDPWIHERIITSIAPSIFGHYEIKEAIALALFGGEPKKLPDDTRIRGDIHILIIGDPGTAKSQMLQFASRIAPRSVYTTGKGSTAAGLTAAVVREKNSGDFYLEAGAMVLADGGVAVIDEIDKMREEDRVAIHEAMEQQTVSIAKAGIVAKLNARASVIAAGNPKFGRYIKERGIADNINLPITILSRFDLIFILKDTPGPEDARLASHILDIHSETKVPGTIPPEFLKKYIAYAKKNVHPKLTAESIRILRDFFVEMRDKGGKSQDSPIAITARQLEALIRISEAYARMSLRNQITEDDVERAINIFRIFLENVGVDFESRKIDIDVIMTGRPKSTVDKMVKILEVIEGLSGQEGCAKIKDIEEEAKNFGIDKNSTNRVISELKKSGEIFEKSSDCFRKA
ncbi:minichromosome maintenance protein MCM [Sulfolobales archaeon HS-7]|nr:minichromosome maintenance protein MCM [Sulfolobales archaeon HS-7]